MAGSLSGTLVNVETAIFVNPFLFTERKAVLYGAIYDGADGFEKVMVPEGHCIGGVDRSTYDGYRKGLDSACADVVITSRLFDRTPAVLASKRAPGKLFGNKWWMQGGAIHSYRLITDFIVERAEKECGVRPRIEGFIGVFRICADDLLGSTLNLCYVGFVRQSDLAKAQGDIDHKDLRLLTLADIEGLPKEEKHWYPMLAFQRALMTMP